MSSFENTKSVTLRNRSGDVVEHTRQKPGNERGRIPQWSSSEASVSRSHTTRNFCPEDAYHNLRQNVQNFSVRRQLCLQIPVLQVLNIVTTFSLVPSAAFPFFVILDLIYLQLHSGSMEALLYVAIFHLQLHPSPVLQKTFLVFFFLWSLVRWDFLAKMKQKTFSFNIELDFLLFMISWWFFHQSYQVQ